MVKHAIILAAGLGTRMRPLTNTCPKPLIIIKDKPLIQYCIDLLFFVGIEKICINTHYMSNMLIEYLTSLNEKRIVISDETDLLLDTGGGIKKAFGKLDVTSSFVLNSDIFWSIENKNILDDMNERFNVLDMDALLCLSPLTKVNGYNGFGDFYFYHKNSIDRFGENQQTPFVYSGIQIIKKEAFDSFTELKFSVNNVWDNLILNNKLSGIRNESKLFHVGTPDMVKEINEF